MFYVPQLPCYKVYKKANHAMQIVWFENEISNGHFHRECVGSFLIEFLEMDLSEYAKALNAFIKEDAFNFRLQVEIGYRGVCDKMRDAVDLLSGNLHLHRFLISDIEKCFAKEEWSDPEQLSNAFAKLSCLMELQKQFELGLSFCLDDTTYPIAKARKYLAFMQHHPQFRSYIFQTGYGLMPVDKQGNLDYETVRQINDNDVDIEGQLAALQKENGGMSMLPFTWILSFEDLIYYDFLELLSTGLTVKKCKLCNQLFVLKSKHRAEYCDRKTENGRTCKQVGPKILFNAELEKAENAPLKEYDRIRKLRQQQLERDRNKDADKAQSTFDAWSEPAMVARAQFVAGEISGEMFLTEINKCHPLTASEEGNP